jgi:hypothetical protein
MEAVIMGKAGAGPDLLSIHVVLREEAQSAREDVTWPMIS